MNSLGEEGYIKIVSEVTEATRRMIVGVNALEHVGGGTGLYNGLSVLIGGVGGSLVPGTIVALTGDFSAGLLSIVVGALLGSVILGFLARAINY